MEAAAYLASAKKIKSITVIGMEKYPFERVLGSEIGEIMYNLHQTKGGISFIMESVTSKFIGGADGKVQRVVVLNNVTKKETTIDADFVIIGAGVIPSTEYLKGVELGPMGAIKVNEHFAVIGAKNVYAAGDIAMYPYWLTGEIVRVEHFAVAMQQGRIAARNMMGGNVQYNSIPFFWTSQFGVTIRYAGHAMKVDRRIFVGDVKGLKFVCYFVTDNHVSAVVTVGADPVAVAASELMRLGKMPPISKLESGSLQFCNEYLKQL
jgi:NADPH-dependent 2,4-dienoyl-CoA reductase/sulfur reductase-like enzyme